MTYVWLTWLADALRAEGCVVVEEGDWKHRGRPSSSGSFNPYGVLWHHTGTTASASNPFPSKNVLINGRSDLQGPLAQVGIGYDGKCHIIAAGRANHAGECNGYGPFSSGDGNSMMVGFEIDYNGTQPMSAAQKDAAARASAACLKRFKRNETYVAIHAETSTSGKWDTGGVPGSTARSLTKTQLEGDDVPLTDDDIRRIWAYPNTVDGNTYSMGELMRWTYMEARDSAGNVWAITAPNTEDGEVYTMKNFIRYIHGNTVRLMEPGESRQREEESDEST